VLVRWLWWVGLHLPAVHPHVGGLEGAGLVSVVGFWVGFTPVPSQPAHLPADHPHVGGLEGAGLVVATGWTPFTCGPSARRWAGGCWFGGCGGLDPTYLRTIRT
jgi:hypothetical protein